MLDNDSCDKLKQMMMMGGWNDVVVPALANRANAAIKALIVLPSEREGEFKGMDDNHIRIRIQEIEWMLSAWKNEVAINAHNRLRDELDSQSVTANP